MDILKLKEKLKNLDLNTLFASIVSTIGAMNTQDFIQLLYFVFAIGAQCFGMYLSYKREKISREQQKVEIEIKRMEANKISEETKSIQIKNNIELKKFENDYEK